MTGLCGQCGSFGELHVVQSGAVKLSLCETCYRRVKNTSAFCRWG